MNYVHVALLLGAVIGSSAYANTYVRCEGESGYELELSSEGADNYRGPAGKNWSLKLDEDADWIGSDKNIVASQFEDGGKVIVEITMTANTQTPLAKNVVYRLIGLYDEEPLLEKYSATAAGGRFLEDTIACVSGND